MRVISGRARGHRLKAPPGDSTRPMLDEQKERLFNILRDVSQGAVLDIFAGSGALGLEALSRGATHGTFVEKSPRAASVLRENIAHCGFSDDSSVLVLDAFRVDARRLVHPVGLVLCDPPFPLVTSKPEKILELLAHVVLKAPREKELRLMLRVPRPLELPPWPEALVPYDRRDAGESVFHLLCAGPEPTVA